MAMQLVKNNNCRVLLIDLDPQSSLTNVCLEANNVQIDNLKRNQTLNYIYTVYQQARKIRNVKLNLAEDVIKKVSTEKNIDFIPNNLFSEFGGLDSISMKMGNEIENLLILRDFLEDNYLDQKYDFIFFDCPPSNNVITQSAFLVSDYYIIPTIMDGLSTRGVQHYISTVKNIYKNYYVDGESAEVLSVLFGKEPKLIGVFETLRKGPSKSDDYRGKIKNLGYYVFDSEIKHLKEISETISKGNESTNEAYYNLIVEFARRIKELEDDLDENK